MKQTIKKRLNNRTYSKKLRKIRKKYTRNMRKATRNLLKKSKIFMNKTYKRQRGGAPGDEPGDEPDDELGFSDDGEDEYFDPDDGAAPPPLVLKLEISNKGEILEHNDLKLEEQIKGMIKDGRLKLF